MELLARYDVFPACGDILVPQGSPTSNPAAPLGLAVAETATAYRSRHPEQTAFYQLFDKHFDDYVYAYEERFEAKAGHYSLRNSRRRSYNPCRIDTTRFQFPRCFGAF